ncbi:hypothetical protein J1605_013203 [Eschrichtius robustus]|uniref:Uncharacterized protein n=1 Tax=Eschrichtius robustus TaxID=9764 RepID=A0AB34GKP7_ESCRO|nr:hypothetical protein J1605_013203 [Eschrichtius robustus]
MRAGPGRTPAPGWGLRDGAGRGTPVQSRPARGYSTCDTGRQGTHRRERQASQGPGAGGSGGPRAGGDPARAGAALGWGRKLSWSSVVSETQEMLATGSRGQSGRRGSYGYPQAQVMPCASASVAIVQTSFTSGGDSLGEASHSALKPSALVC